MRLSGTKTGAINQYRGLGNQLWDLAGNRPSLDLPFSDTKSLVDTTTGTNLIDHTRAASISTYVGSDGLIKTAAANLLLQSEDFSTTWINLDSSDSTNQATGPDGTLTADKIIEDITNNIHGIYQTLTITAGVTYTFSVWLKQAERSYAQLRLGNATWSNAIGRANVTIDLSDGSVVASTVASSDYSIQPYPNGWYRVSLKATALASGTGLAFVFITDSAGGAYTGDGTSGIYLWGAQLEQSSTVGEYVKTTSTINSAPRFDHDPTTGESLGLLVEEQRTNLLLRSEDFSTTWSAFNASVLINQTTAPDGTTTADKLICGTGTPIFQGITQTFTATTAATRFSVYVKAGELNQVELRTFDPTELAIFDLSDGTVVATSGDPDASIVDAGNGWYRCSISAPDTGIASVRISLADGGDRTFTPVTDAGIYIWGAQLEEGPFPTSYIPTEGSTVTRAADVASISGTNFSSWYRQDQGTVFYDTTIISAPEVGNPEIVSVSDGTANNYLGVFIPSQLNHRAVVKLSGANEYLANAIPTEDVFEPAKVALAYQEDNTISAGNGALAPLDTSCTLPTVDQFHFGQPIGGPELSQRIRRLVFWPARLPDETLQGITQQ